MASRPSLSAGRCISTSAPNNSSMTGSIFPLPPDVLIWPPVCALSQLQVRVKLYRFYVCHVADLVNENRVKFGIVLTAPACGRLGGARERGSPGLRAE